MMLRLFNRLFCEPGWRTLATRYFTWHNEAFGRQVWVRLETVFSSYCKEETDQRLMASLDDLDVYIATY